MADRHELERVGGQRPRTPVETVDGLVTGAGRAAGWLLRTGLGVARGLPGADIAERQLRRLEQAAVAEVRRRLDDTTGFGEIPAGPLRWNEADQRYELYGAQGGADGAAGGAVQPEPLAPSDNPLRAAMAALLNRSVTESRTAAQDYLFATIVRQLVPDEARIVAALGDGTTYPLVHVAERGVAGGTHRIVLRNASAVGKASGVTLPEQTPVYVSRLIAFGVAEVGAEQPDLDTQYDILLTETYVRAAEQRARRPRILRHTLRISELGSRFWRACDPSIQQLPRDGVVPG